MKPTKKNQPIWIVTDVDGTLMDHKYDLTPALDTIALLKKNKIPIILCTSKTASEVRQIRSEIGIRDPFIVENGGAIYGYSLDSDSEWELILGRNYKELRGILNQISKDIEYELRPLNELKLIEIKELTGLDDEQISLALDRHWSVPFLTPPDQYTDKLVKLKTKYGVNIYKGNRMSHLLDKNSHKGKAINKLKEFLGIKSVYVIALGDSQNDLPLLNAADLAIVIPGINGPNKSLEPELQRENFLLAPQSHAVGWSISINNILGSLLN